VQNNLLSTKYYHGEEQTLTLNKWRKCVRTLTFSRRKYPSKYEDSKRGKMVKEAAKMFKKTTTKASF